MNRFAFGVSEAALGDAPSRFPREGRGLLSGWPRSYVGTGAVAGAVADQQSGLGVHAYDARWRDILISLCVISLGREVSKLLRRAAETAARCAIRNSEIYSQVVPPPGMRMAPGFRCRFRTCEYHRHAVPVAQNRAGTYAASGNLSQDRRAWRTSAIQWPETAAGFSAFPADDNTSPAA